ncbi:zinc finger and BTB domain-containing protein 11 [Melanotaenia boesemani]|uniref:zinc finger and BTB domain-containing protein 11 n=1 Tax=Melanotaenia boesemani TaxID=1250792 RepID=UPI001C03B3C4|nr:zinc finger and BTB domain-containing protein 11 [Melanotaenia boesemani]
MSCEESYLAIIRYLTDEREPYAPGTPGNTKRKIRKAAACYVVRNGTLFYQRRLKGQNDFTELEVVLQDSRRKELINEAHIIVGGEHLNQQLTWEIISQKYWWRGILKNVKDHIRECAHCQSRRGADDGSGPRPFSRPGRRRAAANDEEEEEEEEEEEGDDSLFVTDLSFQQRSKVAKTPKHEVVFVDSKGEVNQFLPKHSQTMLDKLNKQRLSNQFCDITLLIEGEEYRAHKAVLAACSEYFNELFFEKGAATTHEAVVDLSGFAKASFLPLLDFAYTSTLTFNFCIMADIANLARHLLMTEVLQICESVHKQVEEQKLTVYQKGDVHTVVSSEMPSQEASKNQAEAYMVTIQGDGRAVVTHSGVAVSGESLAFVEAPKEAYIHQPVTVVTQTVEGEALHAGEAEHDETVALIAHSGHVQPGDTVTVISGSAEGMEGETMTVVTHSGQAGASESLAVVSACLAMEQPQVAEAGAFVINVDPDRVSSSEVAELESAAPPPPPQEEITEAQSEEPAPPPPKRKRGRPAKAKKEVEELIPLEEDPSADDGYTDKQELTSDDPSRRRLRQRSMAEGGYARLHMGLEDEEEGKKSSTPPRAATPKVGPRHGKRGRPPKQPVETQVEEQPECEPAAETTTVESPMTAEVGTEEAETKELEPETGAKQHQATAQSAVDGEHTCSECGMSFQRRYSLIMHTLKHEKARGYKCSLCSKEFQYAASLQAHLARHKQQSSQRAAATKMLPENGSEGRAGGDLDEKTSASHTIREFVCDICGKTLPKLYSLRIHMLNHTGVRPHSCKVCGKTFAHKHSLKMHRALHDVTKQFQCEFCKKSFVSKRSMEEHTSLHTGESKYLCNTCGATFHRASALSKHLKKHQPRPEFRSFACSHCDKSFYEAKDLQQHMNKHMGLKPFQCQVCGKCYSWKKDWYSHVKSHSVAEPFKCNVCGKEFFEKALFRRHVKKATHGKKGRVKQNLERECEQCGRKFTQLREYRRHINNHQGVKPFECLTCGVAWADARSLKRHVRTHTGERPYVCPMCQEAHIDARTLRKHMAKYHMDNLPGKIMLEKDTLQFHNQGTQVEHAVSILASDLPPELRPAQQQPSEDIETVLITEETVEAVEAVQAVQAVQAGTDGSVATLSDQGIMQVVNYVLAQQALTGTKGEEAPEVIQTMEVEVAHVTEVE